MKNKSFTKKFILIFFLFLVVKLVIPLFEIYANTFVQFIAVLTIIIFIVFLIASSGKGINQGGRTALIDDNLFQRLYKKYEDLAKKYIQEKNYRKAAKIYMNLLKDNYQGAKTLEEGQLYNEAAYVHLKKMNNKQAAALCYEKAKNYKKAINLYTQLNEKEKLADIYSLLGDTKNASHYYNLIAIEYLQSHKYLKAALVYKNKMNNLPKAQQTLLQGWNENKDAFNCLNNYFANINDIDLLEKEIKQIYQTTSAEQKTNYLKLMIIEFKKNNQLERLTRDIAYEIISEHENKTLIDIVKVFNPNDRILTTKDIFRYKTNHNIILST